jgi:hypothetical protein
LEHIMVDLYIDTQDRINGTPNDCEIIMNDVYDTSGQWRIALKSMQFMNLTPNISSAIGNQQFRVNALINGVTVLKEAVFPDDHYTIEQVVDVLNASIAPAFNSDVTVADTRWINFTYDNNLNKVQVTVDVANVASVVDVTNATQYIVLSDALCEQLGLVNLIGRTFYYNRDRNGVVVGAGRNTYTIDALFPPQLEIPYVDVHINFPMNTFHSSGLLSNVIQRVPIGANYGGWTLWENDDMNAGQLMKSHYLTTLRIRVTLPNGTPFLTPPHSNISYHFKLTRADF